MGYEDFRQMVLGSHLVPMKSKEIQCMIEKKSNKEDSKPTQQTLTYRSENLPEIKTVRITGFRAFKARMDVLKKELKKEPLLELLEEINSPQVIDSVLSGDFDASYFYMLIMKSKDTNIESENIGHLLDVLYLFMENVKFKLLIIPYLSKSEKRLLREYLTKLNNLSFNPKTVNLIELFI